MVRDAEKLLDADLSGSDGILATLASPCGPVQARELLALVSHGLACRSRGKKRAEVFIYDFQDPMCFEIGGMGDRPSRPPKELKVEWRRNGVGGFPLSGVSIWPPWRAPKW